MLRRDELVATRKEAQTVYYSLRSHEVREMIGLLHRLYCSEPNKTGTKAGFFSFHQRMLIKPWL